MFNRDEYVKIVDTCGNYRYGFITKSQESGDLLTVDLTEEGLCKIQYDDQFGENVGIGPKDFQNLLTESEKKLVPLLAQGLETSEIAVKLEKSPVTIRSNIRTLRLKLGMDNREQLVAYAQGIEKVI